MGRRSTLPRLAGMPVDSNGAIGISNAARSPSQSPDPEPTRTAVDSPLNTSLSSYGVWS
jgi:hypothetical protein